MLDQIYSYREMCDIENVQTLQRGMNFRMNPRYSVILMSRRSNAPYSDSISDDGITIEYEGHDEPKTSYEMNPKLLDQPQQTRNGTLTQNGKFIKAVEDFKNGISESEIVKVYEKILPGVWSLKGLFDLIDYNIKNDGKRNVFVFTLKLSDEQDLTTNEHIDLAHTRLIPSEVKKEVWKRDAGKCVLCGSTKNLHFDHDLPFSRGGTSLTTKNIRLLCAKCNLAKSDKIE
ncbi:MAG: HNH endonuclease [Candidatus Thermoplasmatota archaeon]|nr:HNH endonuclease [Candidatus Thermoplasmatota archaeon]